MLREGFVRGKGQRPLALAANWGRGVAALNHPVSRAGYKSSPATGTETERFNI